MVNLDHIGGAAPTWNLPGPLWIELHSTSMEDSVPGTFHTRAASVKSNLTRSLKYRWSERDENGVMDRKSVESFFFYVHSIYKLDVGAEKFHCIFHPDSVLGWEYIKGNLNDQELRDSIEW